MNQVTHAYLLCSFNGYFVFEEVNYYYLAGLLNSKVTEYIANALNPTMNLSAGVLSKLPVKIVEIHRGDVTEIVKKNIELSKEDWNSFEITWDFKKHPLVKRRQETTVSELIENKFNEWKSKCQERFDRVKTNEEKLNCLFINVYGLGDELTPYVEDVNISVRLAELEREIKSLLSYAVGCIMGRYSLKEEGLIYAGGEWDNTRYSEEFKPCEYGVMTITEEQYFEEDLCTRVIDFIKVVYGEDTLTENLKFIASALKPGSFEAPLQRSFVQ